MLHEFVDVRQIPDDKARRWWLDDYFDLIVWFEEDGHPSGFQLCYDKKGYERALTWNEGNGYLHTGVDDGDSFGGGWKMSPILVADGSFGKQEVMARFDEASGSLDEGLRSLVMGKIRDYPQDDFPPLERAHDHRLS
jgi:hypothetical protein